MKDMILLALLALAGCTAHGRIGALPVVPQPDQAAEIVVIREWRYMGSANNIPVTLNGVPVYGLATREHAIIRVPPGQHIIGIAPKGLWLNESTVNVQADAGQRYYFYIETTVVGGTFLLQPTSEAAGQGLMTKTTRIE